MRVFMTAPEKTDPEKVLLRDVEAAEMILRHPRIFQVLGVPHCCITPAQLRAAVAMAEESGRIAALVCDDCAPGERYFVLRVVDLPVLAAAAYEVLVRAGLRGGRRG